VTEQITVYNRHPIVNASASIYEAYTYFEIAFDGSRSTDEDGSITWLWDFGDGLTSDEKRPTHNWSDDGQYSVNLTVTDDDGATNTTTLDINILNQLPSVYFETSVISGNVTTPIECNATGWDKDGFISEWVWDFGDGNTSNEEDPVYFYGDNGDYIISLFALDDDGAMSNVMNKSVIIVNLPPLANMSASATEGLTFSDIQFFDLSEDLEPGGAIQRHRRAGSGGGAGQHPGTLFDSPAAGAVNSHTGGCTGGARLPGAGAFQRRNWPAG